MRETREVVFKARKVWYRPPLRAPANLTRSIIFNGFLVNPGAPRTRVHAARRNTDWMNLILGRCLFIYL